MNLGRELNFLQVKSIFERFFDRKHFKHFIKILKKYNLICGDFFEI